MKERKFLKIVGEAGILLQSDLPGGKVKVEIVPVSTEYALRVVEKDGVTAPELSFVGYLDEDGNRCASLWRKPQEAQTWAKGMLWTVVEQRRRE